MDQSDLHSLEQIYSKILHESKYDSVSEEKQYRFNQLLHIREQLNHLADIFLQENLFYLPYLLIPN